MYNYDCRYNYLVELVEPVTPWREDVRVLAQKNTHNVPREKIRDMLEKQKVKIDINMVIESCRKRTNQISNDATMTLSTLATTQSNAALCNNIFTQKEWTSQSYPSPNFVIESKNQEGYQSLQENRIPFPAAFPSQFEENLLPHSTNSFEPPNILPYTDPAISIVANSTCEVAIQTSLSESEQPLRVVMAHSRSIQTSCTMSNYGKKPSSTKLSLDKGCLTDEIVEELATREALAILKSYFPSKETEDLADFLKQCNGDLTW